jgi:hypothetical protein
LRLFQRVRLGEKFLREEINLKILSCSEIRFKEFVIDMS